MARWSITCYNCLSQLMCVGPAKTLLNKLSCQVQAAAEKNDKFQEWQLFLDSTFQAKLKPWANGVLQLHQESQAGFKEPNFTNTYRITHFKMSMTFLLAAFHKQTNSKLSKALHLLKAAEEHSWARNWVQSSGSTFSPHIPTPSSWLFNKNQERAHAVLCTGSLLIAAEDIYKCGYKCLQTLLQ